MTNKKATKRALTLSIISMLICVVMLAGTTFAWFTDSVTSGVNQIVAGNLDVELYHTNETDRDEKVLESTKLFDKVTLWEPGAMVWEKLKVVNEGTLALKYNLEVNFDVETATKVGGKTLADVLQVAVLDAEPTRDTIMAASTVAMKDFALNANGVKLDPKGSADNYDEFYVAIYWAPTADDNYFNLNNGKTGDNGEKELKIDLGVKLVATQVEHEFDSFGNDYDKDAVYAEHYATTADELADAIAKGGEVALMNDIDVSSITVPAGVDSTINLNGKNITSTSTKDTGNQSTFVVKGNLSVKGTGNVEHNHTGANMGWNNLTAVFSVEGGTLTLGEGVNAVNNGNTDMAYAVDVNTTLGKTTLNINGATLYSSYIGVRIFNNHSTEKGIVNYNSGIVYGNKKGYDIWAQLMNCPAENAVVNIAEDINYREEELTGTMYYIDDGKTLVNSPAALSTALAAGGDVVLVDDVKLDDNTTIVVGNGVETSIDLNGNTISAENTNTATHNFLIDVKGGELTMTDGTVALKHTGANMEWNGAATVIDITAGGVLNLKDVTVKNEGGTDMNFAVHLNNWGEVTLNADNCVFDAPYCGVRVFNSGYDMNNVKITNSTITGATRAFWVHNYIGDLNSTQHSDDAINARLNLDIFNNNNTFAITGTAKSPIRYGFGTTVYYDASGNVVA